jgi:hypothetical protein
MSVQKEKICGNITLTSEKQITALLYKHKPMVTIFQRCLAEHAEDTGLNLVTVRSKHELSP